MSRLRGTLIGREQIATSTWAFTLSLGAAEFSFRAGQTIDVTIPEPRHVDGDGNRRTFSLARRPGAPDLLVATRVRGSAFKRSLVEAPLGTALEIEGPFGSFTLPRRAACVVMLAGGIGVTPFRGMVEDALARNAEGSMLLVHSCHSAENAPFLRELAQWSADQSRFRYRPTMTGALESEWSGERQRVGPELLAPLLPADRDAPHYFVAGPDGFVKVATQALAALGVDEDRVRVEEFPGY